MKGDALPQRQSGLMTLGEAAEYVGVKVTTMRDWVWRRRAIPYVSVGIGTARRGRPMIYKRDLDKFLESRRVPAIEVIDGVPTKAR